MKRVCSLLCAVMLLTVFLTPLIQPARAADQEYTFYGTVGETEYFIIHSNAYDEILEAEIYNGVIPGMMLDVSGGATLGLAGIPTTDGEFKVFITMKTKGLGTVDIKVTVYINPAESSSGVPKVTKIPQAKLWWRVNPQPSSPVRTMSASIAGSLHWPMPVSMLLSLQVILARV